MIKGDERTQGGLIAGTLIDELTHAGRSEARERALAAGGGNEDALRREVEPGVLASMFAAAGVDRRFARRVGRRIAGQAEIGIGLRLRGISTPERALRNAQMILPREHPRDVYTSESIERGMARIRFDRAAAREDGPGDDAERLLDAVREGMLQDLPRAFGLGPAAVRETACVHRGDDCCRYEVLFETPRVASFVVAAGGGAFVGLGIALFAQAGPLVGGVAIASLVTAAVAGRWALALRERLRARGDQCASVPEILDLAEHAIAERLDELAKLGASLERVRGAERLTRSGLGPEPASASEPRSGGGVHSSEAAERDEQLRTAVRESARAATLHERALAELREHVQHRSGSADARLQTLLESAAADATALRARLGVLAEPLQEGEPRLGFVDLARVAQDAVTGLRAALPRGATLCVAVDEGGEPPLIHADRLQIEQLLEQLVLNACEACGEAAALEVAVRVEAQRVELEVLDDGPGIESDRVERAFDPFQSGGPAATEGAAGLARCLQIAEAHAGELRVQGRPGRGTAVTVSFPTATPAADAANDAAATPDARDEPPLERREKPR